MYKLQDVKVEPVIGDDAIQHLYYRANNDFACVLEEDGVVGVNRKSFLDFFTYFGSLSAEKWKKYSYAAKFYLVLDIAGSFDLVLFGHYQENHVIKKEWLGRYRYKAKDREKIVVPFPAFFKSQVVAFSINALSNLKMYGASYDADLECDNYNMPYISLVTTTFKKEKFIKNNIELLKNQLFGEQEFKNAFIWHIIDNGQTLNEERDDNIIITHNKNVGGAGGFAKGMIDSLRQGKKPTHILLMDDDVKVLSDSFKRLYRLLNILRPEYTDYFVSGAMLNMDAPNIQHENTGRLVEEGYCVPLHSGRDLNLWDQVILNEEIDDTLENRYAAWWFCCIPTTIARLDNLPLPVFVRGDDMEYSIRNHARFITMNGISIWHQGFVGKFNATMDFYQSKRNELIVFNLHSELDMVDSFKAIEELFWHQLYKFDYVGAEFLIETVEDFLKGPEWFSQVDLFDELQKRRKKDYKQLKIDKILDLIDFDKLYVHEEIPKFKKFIYDYTYNGQARIPDSMSSDKKIGVIPYDFGYYPDKQLLTNVNYAISPVNGTYVELIKDRKKFKRLKKHWDEVSRDYYENKDVIRQKYRDYEKEITNVDFWDNYLKMEKS